MYIYIWILNWNVVTWNEKIVIQLLFCLPGSLYLTFYTSNLLVLFAVKKQLGMCNNNKSLFFAPLFQDNPCEPL